MKSAAFFAATRVVTMGMVWCLLRGVGLAGAGERDAAFQPVFSGSPPAVYAMAEEADGRVIVGGLFSGVGGQARNNMARLGSDGAVDPLFNPDANSYVRCVAVQGDGKIVLGGQFTRVGGVARTGLARVHADGSLDTAFNPVLDGGVLSLAVQSDGKLIVAGGFSTVGSTPRKSIARLLPDGSLDGGFNPGTGPDGPIFHAALQPDGKILVGGAFTQVGTTPRGGIARLRSTGSLDTGFVPPALGGSFPAALCSATLMDGKIVIGGNFATVGGVARVGLARLTASGALDTGFATELDTADDFLAPTAWSLALQADGRMVVGGSFDAIGGQSRAGVARLSADGTVDPGFALAGVSSLTSVGLQGVQLMADGSVVIAGPHLIGSTPAYLSRLKNDPATQSLTRVDDYSAEWLRGGAAPEAAWVALEASTDAGASWTSLGIGSRIAGGWEFFAEIPAGAMLRGRARLGGGTYNGSSSFASSASSASGPLVVTGSVVEKLATAVAVEGFVNPNGLAATAAVQFGTTAAYGGGSVPVALVPADGTTAQTVTAVIAGLQPATTYHYRFTATSAAGTGHGADRTFSTPGAPPTVVTGSVENLTTRSATLTGSIDANGEYDVSAIFEWGPTPDYGNVLAIPSHLFSGSTSPVAVSAALSGLEVHGTYHYRIRAVGPGGGSSGADAIFTTPSFGLSRIEVIDPESNPGLLKSGVSSVAVDGTSGGTGFERLRRKRLRIANAGTGDLVVGSITFLGVHAGDFSVTGGSGETVSPGGKTDVWIRFEPHSPGPRSATMRVASNSTVDNPFEIEVTGTGAWSVEGGSVAVSFGPAGAIAAGGEWMVDSATAWIGGDAGEPVVAGLAAGAHTVIFDFVDGYTTPPRQTVNVLAGHRTDLVAAYSPAPAGHQWTNFAGQPGGRGNVDGPVSEARFDGPAGVAFDAAGNLLVADGYNNRIRKISPAGVVSTLVSGDTPFSGGATTYFLPKDVAVDGLGDVFIACYDGRILKYSAAGVLSVLAGKDDEPGSADGVGEAARFNRPGGLTVDAGGAVIVADTGNHTIRRIEPDGHVTTVAGVPGLAGGTDSVSRLSSSSVALFSSPADVAVDAAGTIYVADGENDTIRKIDPSGVVTTLAGVAGEFGNDDGVGAGARFGAPSGVAWAGSELVVADYYGGIRKVTPGGGVSTLAADQGQFHYLGKIAVDGAGNVYAADIAGHCLHVISPAGVDSILAGVPSEEGLVDETGAAARFRGPQGMAVNAAGIVYVADRQNGAIRTISAGGQVGTLAGPVGGALEALGSPDSLCIDGAGNVYVTDVFRHVVQKVTPAGEISTLAGLRDHAGSEDGTGDAARFHYPKGIAVDAAGMLYVADSSNHTIRAISPEGVVTTLAGMAGWWGAVDGKGSEARFTDPTGVATVGGYVYVSEFRRVRRIAADGTVVTVAAYPGWDGRMVADGAGNLYITYFYDGMIFRLSSAGQLSAIGGRRGVLGAADGMGGAALFSSPYGIGASPDGVLYVADADNNRIVKGVPGGDPVLTESEKWRQQYFGSPANAGLGADGVSPRSDGVVNLLKFATAMNPTQSGRMPGVLTMNGAVMEFSYTRSKAGMADGLGYAVEWSDALAGASWSTAGVVETVVGQDAVVEQVKAAVPAGNGGKRYVRLRVWRP